MYTEKPIENVKGIHYGKILARVLTENHEAEKTPSVKKYFKDNVLQFAGIQTMEVQTIKPNESKTGLIVEGILLDKNGTPLYPKEPARNVIVAELPFNQEHVQVQPGTWFESEERAQEYAAVINKQTKETIRIIKEMLEKIDAFQDELIEKGA